jgi:hypothetical protein
MLLKDRIAKELDRIRRKGGGVVTAEAVVEYAKDPKTALHSQFTWDDSEAAKRWRLEQAGRIIRLQVRVVSEGTAATRVLVSLSSDRKAGGGYRDISAVLNDPDMAKELLADALSEFNAMRRKYGTIKQLAGVWAAVDQVKTVAAAKEESRPAA